MLPTWLMLGWIEFRRSVFSIKGPDGRDFLSLSLLYALVLSLGSLLAAAQDGIVVNFADTLLGRIEPHGSPIRVATHLERQRESIDAEALSLFGIDRADPRLIRAKAFPMREIDSGLIGFPSQDNKTSYWNPYRDGVRQDFAGWAMKRDNPIWRDALDRQPEPRLGSLDIVLNKKVFTERFDYQAYVKALMGYLPPNIIESLPTHWEDLNEIYLQIWISSPSTGQGASDKLVSALLPLRVTWVDSLPSLTQTAYLLPAAITSGLEMSQESPRIKFDPLALFSEFEVVHSVKVFGNSRAMQTLGATELVHEKVSQCLGEGVSIEENPLGDFNIALPSRLPVQDIEPCLTVLNFKPHRDYMYIGGPSPSLKPLVDGWSIACQDFPRELLTIEGRRTCADGLETTFHPYYTSWDKLDVYSAERQGLVQLRNALSVATISVGTGATQRSKSAFEIGSLYSDSITRFGYLVGVINWIVKPIGILSFFAVTYFLIVQMMVLVEKRRRAYGMLLARGMRPQGLRLMLAMQVLLSVSIGAVVAVLIAEIFKLGFGYAFEASELAAIARRDLGEPEPRLIDYFREDNIQKSISYFLTALSKIAWLVCMVVFVSLIASIALLRFFGLKSGAEPINLLK